MAHAHPGARGIIKAGVASWYRIQELFRFPSFQPYGVIGWALAGGCRWPIAALIGARLWPFTIVLGSASLGT